MTKNPTWLRLTQLRAEVLALTARCRDGTATLPDDVFLLESLARPVGKRTDIERMIAEGKTDAEIVKELGCKKQQANLVRQQLKERQRP